MQRLLAGRRAVQHSQLRTCILNVVKHTDKRIHTTFRAVAQCEHAFYLAKVAARIQHIDLAVLHEDDDLLGSDVSLQHIITSDVGGKASVAVENGPGKACSGVVSWMGVRSRFGEYLKSDSLASATRSRRNPFESIGRRCAVQGETLRLAMD